MTARFSRSERDERAVIDRAYSRKWPNLVAYCVLFLVIAASLAGQARSVVITGKVEMEGGAPLSARFYQPLYGRTTMSMFVEPIGSTRALAPVRTDGTVSIRVPGTSLFRVSMTDLPFGIYVKSITSGSQDFEIPIPFRMSVRGRIQADNGEALQLTVRATKHKGLSSSQFAKHGLVDMKLQEGSYTIAISNPPAGYVVSSITYGTLDLLKSPLIINRDTSIAELRVVLTRTP